MCESGSVVDMGFKAERKYGRDYRDQDKPPRERSLASEQVGNRLQTTL
jgi:hypothetical protein